MRARRHCRTAGMAPSLAVRMPACKPTSLSGLAACGSKPPLRPQPSHCKGEGATAQPRRQSGGRFALLPLPFRERAGVRVNACATALSEGRHGTLTCSAHAGLQADIAQRARRMRLETPASPPTLSLQGRGSNSPAATPVWWSFCLAPSPFQGEGGGEGECLRDGTVGRPAWHPHLQCACRPASRRRSVGSPHAARNPRFAPNPLP